MNKQNKRGISTIIATVLIVLITVAAVTILWAAVSPLLDQSADLGCFEVASAVKIDTSKAYTYYEQWADGLCYLDANNDDTFDSDEEVLGPANPPTNLLQPECDPYSGGASKKLIAAPIAEVTVRVERGADSDALKGLKLFIDNNGNTVGDSDYANYDDPTNLEPSVFDMDVASEEIKQNGAKIYKLYPKATLGTVKLSVSPQVEIDGEVTSCEAGAPVDVTAL